MFDLVRLLKSAGHLVQPPVLVVGASPAQSTDMIASLPDMPVDCFQFDVHQAEKLRGQLMEIGSQATVFVEPDLWDVPRKYRTVVFACPAHGERELKIDVLEQSYHVLENGGRLISLSEYTRDSLLPKQHKKLFDKTGTLPATRWGSVFFSTRIGDKPRRRHEMTFHAKIGEGASRTFVSRPGTFSYGAMDAGSRALLEVAELDPGQTILDLGCGCGTVGILAADRVMPGGSIWFVDSNRRATGLAELNARTAGLTHFHVRTAAHTDDLPGNAFHAVLANPPYYANSWIAQRFIEQSFRLLKVGGDLHIVTKMPGHIAPRMIEIFGDITAADRRGYTVLRGRKGGLTEELTGAEPDDDTDEGN